MLRSSFPIGRWMGVDLRLHVSFPLLLLAAMAYSIALTGNALRGVGLWAALVFAVAVRETARCLAAAYLGVRLRALFLLPVGGVMAMAPQEAGAEPSMRLLVLAAPVANFSVGLLMLALCYASVPGIPLLAPPWLSPAHVLRSFVWTQFVLGVVNLLPTVSLPSRRNTRGHQSAANAPATAAAGGPAFSLLSGLAVAMIMAGILTTNIWVLVLGFFLLLGSQLKPQPTLDAEGSDGLRVADVMLTDSVMLSSSDTLRGALTQTVHSLQDVFPVVRGDRLVGSVSRQTIADRLQLGGDSYLQGIMTRTLHPASADEDLVAALRRTGARGASELIPVIGDGRLLGILTPHSLARAVQQVKLTRSAAEDARQ